MMAWETLDDTMIDKTEEEDENANKAKFEDVEDDEFNSFVAKLKFQEIMQGGLISQKMLHKCKTKMRMKILTVLHHLILSG